MPLNDFATQVVSYPMAHMGVNLHDNILEMNPAECLLAQNCVWENGMVKRDGQALVSSNQVVSSKKILGLHRFYKADGTTSQTLAACDTTVKYLNAGSWTNAVTGLTTGLNTNFTTWGALNKAYICNGTDAMRSWDGSSAATITIADGVPVQALPYQDRLLTIIGGYLTWSASYSDTGANWEVASNTGVKPDTKLYGMCLHSISNESSSFDTKVLLAGANGMYLFFGRDLRVPSTTGDYSVYPLALPVGCVSPRTMCWTPAGTMWLGADKQVYLLPFNSVSPIIVGTKIQSNLQGTIGLKSIPDNQMANACAVYHNGYYKLSVASVNGTTNTIQWWADVKRGMKDERGNFGPWYGPMLGQSISCFANMNGFGDSGDLLGGESTDKGGYVYTLATSGQYGDINPADASSKAISVAWQTYYNPLGNPHLRKDVHKIEAELLDVLGTVTVEFHDITGSIKTGDSFGLSGSAIYFDDAYWDEQYWSSSMPTRRVVDISPAIQPRRLSMTIKHSNATDKFEIYALHAEVKEQSGVFF